MDCRVPLGVEHSVRNCFIAYVTPRLFGGQHVNFQPFLSQVSAMLGSCLWSCILRNKKIKFLSLLLEGFRLRVTRQKNRM